VLSGRVTVGGGAVRLADLSSTSGVPCFLIFDEGAA